MIRLKRQENPPAPRTPAAIPAKPVAAAEPAASRPTTEVVPAEASAEAKDGAWRLLPLDGVFEFAYRDEAGNSSVRRLSGVELKIGPGKLLLGGIDARLEAYRGFRVDRIHSLKAMESGEVVTRNILDWLMDRAHRQERARTRSKAGKEPAEARAG